MDYVELTKPRVTALVVLTTWLGYSFANTEKSFSVLWFLTLLGTALTAAGASALNQYLERDLDAKMRRESGLVLGESDVARIADGVERPVLGLFQPIRLGVRLILWHGEARVVPARRHLAIAGRRRW